MSRIIELFNKVKGKDIVDNDSYLMGLSDMLKSVSDIVKNIDDLNLSKSDISILSATIKVIQFSDEIDIKDKASYVGVLDKIIRRKRFIDSHKETIKRLKG